MKLTKKQIKRRLPKPTIDAKTKREISDIVTNAAMAAMFKVLHDEYGFGKQRLERFNRQVIHQLELMAEKYVSYQDILEMIKDETGFDWCNA